jgi:hypothetical protein
MARISAGALAIALVLSASLGDAAAERSSRAGVIVSLDGSVAPQRLPRDRPVPVFLTLSGKVRTVDSSPPPHLARISFDFGASGAVSTAGLPGCPYAQLRATSPRRALAACEPALIGRGHVAAIMDFPDLPPIRVVAELLAFNGRTADGRTVIRILVYPRSRILPSSSFVLPFYLQRLDVGGYGATLRSTVSRTLGRWWRLRSFRITLGRRYRADGNWRSLLSANCPLPPRFSVGIFPLARATYHFDPAPTVTTTILRACRVRP